jgi:hypothetical protein
MIDVARDETYAPGDAIRAVLKIRWCESTVSVRARPLVLLKFLQIGTKY